MQMPWFHLYLQVKLNAADSGQGQSMEGFKVSTSKCAMCCLAEVGRGIYEAVLNHCWSAKLLDRIKMDLVLAGLLQMSTCKPVANTRWPMLSRYAANSADRRLLKHSSHNSVGRRSQRLICNLRVNISAASGSAAEQGRNGKECSASRRPALL